MDKEKSRSHSVRTTDEIWERARKRSRADSISMNAMINELLEGYGRGLIDLPTVIKKYVNKP